MTPEDPIKFKEVSNKVKTFIKNNRVLWFYQTMEWLDAIIKDLRPRNNANRKCFVLKNQLQFKQGSVRLMNVGYIVKVNPANVFVVLKGDLFRKGVKEYIA